MITEGFVFLGKKLEIVARPGHGRLILGKWVHLGDETRLRAHEGTLRIGDKVVFARDVTVNCYLDIEIGASTLIADWTYICDFDHKTEDLDLPIKDQGLVKSPVRIGPDCWLATKVTVTRGADIGRGVVIGANSVARGNIPEYSDRRRHPRRGPPRPSNPVRSRSRPAAPTWPTWPRANEEVTARLRAGAALSPPDASYHLPPEVQADEQAGNGPRTTGDKADVTMGFSSYSPVGHYVPEVVEEETQRG